MKDQSRDKSKKNSRMCPYMVHVVKGSDAKGIKHRGYGCSENLEKSNCSV